MLNPDQCAAAERSIQRLEATLRTEVSDIRKELFALRSALSKAESRVEHKALMTDMRNNFRWVMAAIFLFAGVGIYTIVLAALHY